MKATIDDVDAVETRQKQRTKRSQESSIYPLHFWARSPSVMLVFCFFDLVTFTVDARQVHILLTVSSSSTSLDFTSRCLPGHCLQLFHANHLRVVVFYFLRSFLTLPFITPCYRSCSRSFSVMSVLPFDLMNLTPDSQVFLNIPMDAETPSQVCISTIVLSHLLALLVLSHFPIARSRHTLCTMVNASCHLLTYAVALLMSRPSFRPQFVLKLLSYYIIASCWLSFLLLIFPCSFSTNVSVWHNFPSSSYHLRKKAVEMRIIIVENKKIWQNARRHSSAVSPRCFSVMCLSARYEVTRIQRIFVSFW